MKEATLTVFAYASCIQVVSTLYWNLYSSSFPYIIPWFDNNNFKYSLYIIISNYAVLYKIIYTIIQQ